MIELALTVVAVYFGAQIALGLFLAFVVAPLSILWTIIKACK